MDPRINGFSGSMNGIQLRNQSVSVYPDQGVSNVPKFQTMYSDQTLVNGARVQIPYVDNNYNGIRYIPSDPLPNNIPSASSLGVEDDFNEDCDFSDAVLNYIHQMLMEEDMDDKTHMLQESLELQAKEKSLYEALGKKYPPSPLPEHNGTCNIESGDSPEEPLLGNPRNSISGCSDWSDYLNNPSWNYNPVDYNYDVSHLQSVVAYNSSYSSVSSSNSMNTVIDGFLDSPVSPLRSSDAYNESQSIWNFKKGVEEASKFLPVGDKFIVNNLDVNEFLPQEPKGKTVEITENDNLKEEGEYLESGSRRRKNRHSRDVDLEEERSSKQAAVFADPTIRTDEFDLVLLHSMGKGHQELIDYRTRLHDAKMQQNGPPKGSTGAKGRGKRQNAKKEVVDLRTLLISCAQAVAADDRRNANELLKQIRQHSSSFGDGTQRLANCLADGLEARLAGVGSQIYKTLVNKRTSAANYLKAYHLYLASSPFRKISSFASNKTIINKSQKAMRVHIIDFGILYGFQYPTLLQRIAGRKGGPPKIRITGIEFPQPGFRPAERIEETGRRLADYARDFNVPFEYNAIAKKWETIRLEDLKIEKDEFVVVNSMYRFMNLHDETVAVESARTIVLNLIRKINPDIFIHGIVNGAYSAPFFVTRFREAMFHFSSLFDMLETNVPRETPERMLIEREIFGREAMNVIACEGWERVERPETYKQWQVRHLKAGFTRIPFEREIMNRAIEKVKESYHKDFVIDEDNKWMLLGWKGRTIYALSCWTPV